MITMHALHARPRQTDWLTDGQAVEYRGNSATIRSNERIANQNSAMHYADRSHIHDLQINTQIDIKHDSINIKQSDIAIA